MSSRRRTRASWLAAAAAVLTLTLIAAGGVTDRTEANSAQPLTPSRSIVALGDSYIAGIGADAYVEHDGCRRSMNSYPRRLAQRWGADLIDRSCPGATVSTTMAQAGSLPRTSAVILIQVGGNDMGFVEVAGACFIASGATCRSAVSQAHSRLDTMRLRLVALARDLRRRLPEARIVILGYPRLLASPRSCATLLEADRVRRLNRLQLALDRHLERAARDAATTFIDWPRSVDRHSICSPDPWFVTFDSGKRLDDLLHPTSEATGAMARTLARRLG